MMSMDLQFPWWTILLLVLVKAWPVTLLVTLALTWLGIARPGWLRWLCLLPAAVLASALLFFVFVLVRKNIQSRHLAADNQRYADVMNETLTHPWTGDGITLPAGTHVEWTNSSNPPDKLHFESADLPTETFLFGLPFTGSFTAQADGWTGTLARDAPTSGWWCHAEERIELRHDGSVQSCLLARDGAFHGLTVPAGSSILLSGPAPSSLDINIALGKSIPLHDGSGVTVPGGAQLELRSNGSVSQISNIENLIVRGVPLAFQANWVYPEDPPTTLHPIAISGDLAAPFPCNNATLSKNDYVAIDLRTNTLTANAMADGTPFAGKAVSHCHLHSPAHLDLIKTPG